MIPDSHKLRFEQIKRAAAAADLGLLECIEKATGKTVVVLCIVQQAHDESIWIPLAQMLGDNAMQELVPNLEGT